MASTSQARKRKNRPESPVEQSPEPAPKEQPQRETSSRRSSTRVRTPSNKQEALSCVIPVIALLTPYVLSLNHVADLTQNEQLLAKIKKLEQDNVRLKNKALAATRAATASVQDEDDDDLDHLPVESEDEQEYITEAKKTATTFRSRGIYNADGKDPKKIKTLRRMEDPAARPPPVRAAVPSRPRTAGSQPSSRPSSAPPPPPEFMIDPQLQLDHGSSALNEEYYTDASSRHQSRDQTVSRTHSTAQDTPSRSSSTVPTALARSASSVPSNSSRPVVNASPPFRGGVVPTGDAKASDYEPHATKLILAACRHFEALVLTEDPFPEDAQQEVWVADAWQHASSVLKLLYTLSERIKKLIVSRTSHARGALKDCIRPMVATKYGFSSLTDEAAKVANRTLYEHLLDLNNPEGAEPIFHYQNVDTMASFARNAIVTHAIREQWFRNTDGMGLQLSAQFCPIREATLAIIFTAIEFCLDQWADGTLKSEGGRFSEKEYKPKYKAHLAHIKLWSKLDPAVTEAIRKQMHDDARTRCYANPIGDITQPSAG
uniref:Beta-lactamase (EC) n=1 Tax=Ganoderma boninense TaxID=34458 RepID=A0A5K1K233_9APHY|nr:Beta-lactamase (EC [Ganoderma boninense]